MDAERRVAEAHQAAAFPEGDIRQNRMNPKGPKGKYKFG